MSETMKMPSMEQAFAIAKASLRARNKARQEVQPTKDREAAFYETGNGNPRQLALIKRLLDGHDKNELRALDEAALYQQAIDHFLETVKNRGHVGDLDRMSQAAAAAQAPETAASAADAAFKTQDASNEANRTAAREALELSADGSAGEPPVPPAVDATGEKPKRGRKPKAAVEVGAADSAPPPPPVGSLSDDDDADLRPDVLREKEARRLREEAPGTFAQVH